MSNVTLLNAASATGAAQKIQVSGQYCLAVAGTFGGATVGLQMLGPDNSTWINVEDGAGVLGITSARATMVYIPDGEYRATITGGTGVSISATLKRVMS